VPTAQVQRTSGEMGSQRRAPRALGLLARGENEQEGTEVRGSRGQRPSFLLQKDRNTRLYAQGFCSSLEDECLRFPCRMMTEGRRATCY
jgi:hypothetical protein